MSIKYEKIYNGKKISILFFFSFFIPHKSHFSNFESIFETLSAKQYHLFDYLVLTKRINLYNFTTLHKTTTL